MNVAAKRIKRCFVPGCENCSFSCPEKMFFCAPLKEKDRRKWFRAAGASPTGSYKFVYCCEDHFDVENDVEDLMRTKWYLEMGLSCRLRIKPGVIPHKFPEPVIEREAVLSSEEGWCNRLDYYQAVFSSTKVKKFLNAAVQTPRRFGMKSRSVQATVSMRSIGVSPFMPGTPFISFSPVTVENKKINGDISDAESWETISIGEERTNFIENYTASRISVKPKLYVGVPLESYKFLLELFNSIKCSERDVLLTMKKLKLNTPFFALGDDFGISACQASRVFISTLPRMASELKDLIFWPERNSTAMNLPKSFRKRYWNVNAIIDCFEIPVRNPSDPLKRPLKRPGYQKANSMKYMLSYTPNGFISFISKGYDGRNTDTNIARHCKFKSHLVPGDEIMAARGFKYIYRILREKGGTLVRLPRAIPRRKVRKGEVEAGRRIAALRKHVARVIGRMRMFKFLSARTRVSARFVPILDDAVLIVAALCNLQDPLL